MGYDSVKMLQLLQICAWYSESELSFDGFAKLADKIDAKIRKKGDDANNGVADRKYLGQLLIDLNKNIKTGSKTGRNSKYIQSILNYLDFSDWQAFAKRMEMAESHIDLTKIDASKFEECKIGLFCAHQDLDTIKQSIYFAHNKIDISTEFYGTEELEIKAVLKTLEELTKKNQFIIWAVSNNWDDSLASNGKSPLLLEILNKGQVIPVRIGEIMANSARYLSYNSKMKPPYGKVGLLMALAVIESADNLRINSSEKTKKLPMGSKFNVGKFINNGTVATGDMKQENHGGNNVLGGNIIQHFPTKED